MEDNKRLSGVSGEGRPSLWAGAGGLQRFLPVAMCAPAPAAAAAPPKKRCGSHGPDPTQTTAQLTSVPATGYSIPARPAPLGRTTVPVSSARVCVCVRGRGLPSQCACPHFYHLSHSTLASPSSQNPINPVLCAAFPRLSRPPD